MVYPHEGIPAERFKSAHATNNRRTRRKLAHRNPWMHGKLMPRVGVRRSQQEKSRGRRFNSCLRHSGSRATGKPARLQRDGADSHPRGPLGCPGRRRPSGCSNPPSRLAAGTRLSLSPWKRVRTQRVEVAQFGQSARLNIGRPPQTACRVVLDQSAKLGASPAPNDGIAGSNPALHSRPDGVVRLSWWPVTPPTRV